MHMAFDGPRSAGHGMECTRNLGTTSQMLMSECNPCSVMLALRLRTSAAVPRCAFSSLDWFERERLRDFRVHSCGFAKRS